MTGNFFHLVLTSSVSSLQSAKTATSFSAPYILYICICITPCICVGVLLKHMYSQSLEKDFSSEEFSLQGEPGFSFSKLSAHLGADFLFPSSLSTSDRGPWPLPGPCHWKFPTWKQQGHCANHVLARLLVHSLEILEESDDSLIFFGHLGLGTVHHFE